LLIVSCIGKEQGKNTENIITNNVNRAIKQDTFIGFSNIGKDTFKIEELEQWDSVQSSKIKVISLSYFDTIPKAFEKFVNVEKLNLGCNWNDIFIPDIFPNLKSIELDMAVLQIDKNARFKKNLEKISGVKSTIKSINSFKELPHLKIIDIGYSRFEPFPKDIDKLQHLQDFGMGAYTGKLDITNLHLSSVKTLKKVVLHTWYENAIYGFPNDIMEIDKNVKVEITHHRLTKEQKKILKRFTKPYG
jgi:hypothetical protein